MTVEQLFDAELARTPCACGAQPEAAHVARCGVPACDPHAGLTRVRCETLCGRCGHAGPLTVLTTLPLTPSA